MALTLMNDGFFTHEFGDTLHGNDWWYDELNFDLGQPLGPAQRFDFGVATPPNQITNGGFESSIVEPWRFEVDNDPGNQASIIRDTTKKVSGTASAKISISSVDGVYWHTRLAQYNRRVKQGSVYDIRFWAKADQPRTIFVGIQKGVQDYRVYAPMQQVYIDTTWRQYTVSVESNASASDARMMLMAGNTAGTVWFDNVTMRERLPDVYIRKFTHGMVLLNGTRQPQTITLEPGYERLVGEQAPRYETIIDDLSTAFSTTGVWATKIYDSGLWKTSGPFFHCWKTTCHERSGTSGEARWNLPIEAADTYTLSAWWPAAPEASGWNQNVTYEVIAGDQVLASITLDQRTGGDQWHPLASVPLSPGDGAYVRMSCQGEAPCIADALYLQSQARYNDGSPAEQITLQPMDGLVLSGAPVPPLPEYRRYMPLIESFSDTGLASSRFSEAWKIQPAYRDNRLGIGLRVNKCRCLHR